MRLLRITPGGAEPGPDSLGPIVDALKRSAADLQETPVDRLLDLLDDFAGRLLADPRTQRLEGVMFLANWLKRQNLQALLELNLHGTPAYLDGFQPHGRNYLAAKPHGLVSMWMAGNVATLPMFSLVPALLTKNACLVKLADSDPQGMDALLAVLAQSQTDGLRGSDLLRAVTFVWFDYRDRELNEAMSLAADAKIVWGGSEAVKVLSALPRKEHCVEIIFGPKYSIGLIDRNLLEGATETVDRAVAAFVRDIAVFDQRACSSPQTIFVEKNDRLSLREVGQMFAKHFGKLGEKPGLDAFTTTQILNTRALWAMEAERDVIASDDGANWTVCMDCDVSLKEAIQSRTVFLTEVGSWREIVPLLSPKVQTVGIAFREATDAVEFAESATAAGVARCVRPGLMNVYESPWDGKLLVNQLVRWVSLKP